MAGNRRFGRQFSAAHGSGGLCPLRARGFRVARMLEEALEGAFEALARMPPNPKFAGADQGRAGSGASDAANLAVRAHAVDAKPAVEREKNAITTARLAGD